MKFKLLHEHLETAPGRVDLFRGGRDAFLDLHGAEEDVCTTPKATVAHGPERKEARSSAAVRLANPDAVLSRSDLKQLGYERRAIDAILRSCPIVSLPGYSRPLIKVADFQAFLEQNTYRGNRVRPCRSV
jgi:hypothetical protein